MDESKQPISEAETTGPKPEEIWDIEINKLIAGVTKEVKQNLFPEKTFGAVVATGQWWQTRESENKRDGRVLFSFRSGDHYIGDPDAFHEKVGDFNVDASFSNGILVRVSFERRDIDSWVTKKVAQVWKAEETIPVIEEAISSLVLQNRPGYADVMPRVAV